MADHLLKPDWESDLAISSLPYERFLLNGIKALIIDVDETLLPREQSLVNDSVLSWIERARVHFLMHLASNNPSQKRIQKIGAQLNLEFTYGAAKPSRKSLLNIIVQKKVIL